MGKTMPERVSTIDVRQRIGDMLNRVALRHDEFIIERKGRPMAALVPVERLGQMRRFARRHALDSLEDQKAVRSTIDRPWSSRSTLNVDMAVFCQVGRPVPPHRHEFL